MTNEDIDRMLEQAVREAAPHELYKYPFARIVAAAEREAIAQMVEDAPPLAEFVQNDKGGCMVCGFTPKLAAAAIRARGETR